MTVKASDMLKSAGQTVLGLAKVLIQSRPCSLTGCDANSQRPLIVLANGPSLRRTIDMYGDRLADSDTMAVNFAANAPEFRKLRPKYYVLADPHFYTATQDDNVARLMKNLRDVDWTMTMLIDRRHEKSFKAFAALPSNVGVRTFNAVGTDGFGPIQKKLFDMHLAMPRPRNVLIPALMCAIALGYKEIYICGADHSWMRDLNVSDDNVVVSGMNHFYKESDKETARVSSEYQSYRLHDIVYSLYVAFKSYHDIEKYARCKGVDIYNATDGSYIDAFRRRTLPFE